MASKKQYGVSGETLEKCDDFLREAVVEAQDNTSQPLALMIVLAGEKKSSPASQPAARKDRSELVSEQASAFKEEIRDLLETLSALGARDIQTFWINRTISAVLPLGALDVIGRRPEVKQIQLLRKLPAII